VDPLAHQFSAWSTYTYVLDNPNLFIDPTGAKTEIIGTTGGASSMLTGTAATSNDHTIVTANDDGTYTVTNGTADDDNGIYLDNGQGGKGQKIGKSVSPYSFLYDDLRPVIGAKIYPDSEEGQVFLEGLFADNPSVWYYMSNGKKGQIYDFKRSCMGEGLTGLEEKQYMYSGSVLKNGLIATRRDIGNIGAGWISGRDGIEWEAHRLATDALETQQKTGSYLGLKLHGRGISSFRTFEWHNEQLPTVSAQRYGYDLGWNQLTSKRMGLPIPSL
jgi:hypothetical protein